MTDPLLGDSGAGLGQALYTAYKTTSEAGQRTALGVPVVPYPEWDDLPEWERLAYSTAAVAVRNALKRKGGVRQIVAALRDRMPPMGGYTEQGWQRAADFIEREFGPEARR